MLSDAVKCISLLNLIDYEEMKDKAYLWNTFGKWIGEQEKKEREESMIGVGVRR